MSGRSVNLTTLFLVKKYAVLILSYLLVETTTNIVETTINARCSDENRDTKPTPAKQKQAGFRNYATNEGVMCNC